MRAHSWVSSARGSRCAESDGGVSRGVIQAAESLQAVPLIVQKGVSVRWQSCPKCGHALPIDHNAALNTLRLAQQQRSRPG